MTKTWRLACATCAQWRERLSVGVTVGTCDLTGATTAETDTCDQHSERDG